MAHYYNSCGARTVTQIQHNASLDIDVDTLGVLRMNHIICTIGPKTQTVEALEQLIDAGMNVVRMNFSHGSHAFHGATVENARKAAANRNKIVAIALDTKGPEIRSGKVKGGGEIKYEAGQKVKVSVNKDDYENCSQDLLFCDYANLPNVVKPGGAIFIDDGLLNLQIDEVGADFVMTTAVNSATISDHKGMNLPNVEVDLPAVSEKDLSDLTWGADIGVDMVFASFIRKAEDVRAVREALGPKGKHVLIISKIENHEGVRKFNEILEVSDGIMVARGDLGIEIPPEKVFLAQKMMIANCNLAGKPIICATQMLESMTFNPRPTRAEVSDVANAVLDGADCVMLSGETAKGKYPIETVTIMARICREAQFSMLEWQLFQQVQLSQQDGKLKDDEVICQSAVNTAYEIRAPAIIVLTNTGSTARKIAKYRPRCPVYTVTNSQETARQLSITRACFPVVVSEEHDRKDYDARVEHGIQRARADGFAKAGDSLVIVHAYGDFKGSANLVRILQVK